MSDQFAMFDPTTSGDTLNVTSSPASESGATPFASQLGPMTGKSGQALVPASHSAPQGKRGRSTIRGIYGQSSFASSRHDDLSASLASRYRALTDSLGSTLFELTWITRSTPMGFSIPAQRASEARNEDSVCIGWPTASATDGEREGELTPGMSGTSLTQAAVMVAWQTPTTEDHKSDGQKSKARMDSGKPLLSDLRLRNTALLASWGTPAARDWKSGEASQETLDRNARPLSELAVLAAWKTPCVPNGGRISGNALDLGKHIHGTMHGCACLVSEARLTAFGDQPIGYLLGRNGWEIVPACGQLNASHSRWLMGLPAIWDQAAVAASRWLKKRKRGS